MSVPDSDRSMRRLLRAVPSLLFLSLLFSTQACGQSDTGRASQSDGPVVTHTVMFETTAGTFEFDLYGEDAPLAVANIIGLADSGFYDGILFHRIHPGFLIQTGDPKTKDRSLIDQWGTGGQSIYNGPFPDELGTNTPSGKRGYVRGTVAMSNKGPNSNTSQFFVLLTDVSGMPNIYTIFGKVRSGMDVIDTIGDMELTDIDEYGGRPLEDVRIISAHSTKLDLSSDSEAPQSRKRQTESDTTKPDDRDE